eukprot:TRINITY_DN6816_c0_g1_i1.p1 TRINITY_DN6816_c0_g1~~TRINITY_DN6816_c0_g1_i1.p1  ORF type:complete len:384 (-),score=91.06 TRINITY_DN6816_c0_g1_i1:423-1574(-)
MFVRSLVAKSARSMGVSARCLSTSMQASGLETRQALLPPRVMTSVNSSFASNIPVTLVAGDGIGPELTESVVRVFSAVDAPLVWERLDLTSQLVSMANTIIPPSIVSSFNRNRVMLKGPFYAPSFSGHKSIDFALANKFDLFAYVIHCQNLPGVKTRHSNVDIVVIREYTEGLHLGLEHELVPGVVESLNISTKKACSRIIRYAFNFALRTGRKKVTAVHKANIMKMCDGMFLNTFREIAAEYPTIKFDDMIVDNCSMQLLSKPEKFDVLVTPNMYGNIIGNISASLVGGPGICPGWLAGDHGVVVEQGTHHVASDIAGKNIANPVGILLSGAILLRHLNLSSQAARIERAVGAVLEEGQIRTRDIGGTSTTSEFVDAVIKAL